MKIDFLVVIIHREIFVETSHFFTITSISNNYNNYFDYLISISRIVYFFCINNFHL